jgi:hypothetical protein
LFRKSAYLISQKVAINERQVYDETRDKHTRDNVCLILEGTHSDFDKLPSLTVEEKKNIRNLKSRTPTSQMNVYDRGYLMYTHFIPKKYKVDISVWERIPPTYKYMIGGGELVRRVVVKYGFNSCEAICTSNIMNKIWLEYVPSFEKYELVKPERR